VNFEDVKPSRPLRRPVTRVSSSPKQTNPPAKKGVERLKPYIYAGGFRQTRAAAWLKHPATAWVAVATAWTATAVGVETLRRGGALGDLSGPLAVAALAVAAAGRRRRWVWPALAAGALAAWPLPALVGLVAAVAAAWSWTRRCPRSRLRVGSTRWGWPVDLDAEDRLLHTQVLGPTGSGKSLTVLYPWIRQDLAAGRGLTLIEPKGDLAARVREAALAHGRVVVPFNPLLSSCPHLNVMPDDPAAAGESLALALDQLEPAGHPFYQSVSRVLLVQAVRLAKIAYGDEADLAAVERVVHDTAFRRRLLADAGDDNLRRYFEEEWGALPHGRQVDLAVGLLNRLRGLRVHPALARVLAPPYDFTLDEVLAENLVLLASLNPAELGLGARAAGVLIWHLFVQAAYRLGPLEALRHVLYLDEFHQYVSPDLEGVLAMIRGYGVAMVLAHQNLDQLDATLAAAVAANARTRVVLSGASAEDVARLTRAAAPAPFPDPRYRARGWAVVVATRHGRQTRPQLVRLPPPPGRHGR
jgi:hypothetical protein